MTEIWPPPSPTAPRQLLSHWQARASAAEEATKAAEAAETAQLKLQCQLEARPGPVEPVKRKLNVDGSDDQFRLVGGLEHGF